MAMLLVSEGTPGVLDCEHAYVGRATERLLHVTAGTCTSQEDNWGHG